MLPHQRQQISQNIKAMTNIRDTYDYAAEQAKKDFQAGISSMIELYSHMNSKLVTSLQNKKDGVWISNDEMKTLCEWILDLSGKQMGNYNVLDGANRKTNALFRCALKIQEREQQTPNLKRLLA